MTSTIRRSARIAQIEAALALARELGISVFAQFVVNTNFSRRDFKRLIRFIEHHSIDYPSFTVLTPIPGTELLDSFDHVTERQPNGRPDWDLFDCQNAVVETRLPKEEFRREYRNLYRVFRGSYRLYQERPSSNQRPEGLRASERPLSPAPPPGRLEPAKGPRP